MSESGNPNDEFNRIEDLKKRLYDREAVVSVTKRSTLAEKKSEVPTTWRHLPETDEVVSIFGGINWLYKLAFISVIFFIATLGVAGFLLMSGTNIISNRNIDFVIKAPASVKAGDETPFQIVLANRNRLALEQVKLTIEYPEDTKEPGDVATPLRNKEISIGTVRPGETVNQSVAAALFGNEDDTKEIRGIVEYRVAGSNAVYQKDATYSLRISSPPVSVAITAVPESIVDQMVDVTFTVVSNAGSILKDVMLAVNFPRGFQLVSSEPILSKSPAVWYVGELKPGEQKTFTVKGLLGGINQEVKTFEAKVGTREGVSEAEFDTVFSQIFKTITLKQPFVALSTSVNGNNSAEPVITSGGLVRLDLSWYNSLSSRVTNNELEVKIEGTPFNNRSVSPGTGFYRLSDNTMLWTQLAEPQLSNITPGDTGKVSVTFSTFSLFDASMMNVTNPVITLRARLKGSRISEGFSTEPVETIINRTIKLNSILKLSTKALHKTGPLTNTGPLPPKVDQETTYTVVLSVINTSNDLRNTVLKATLPSGVRFIGEGVPGVEKLYFNEITKEIRWDLGRVLAGTGTRTLPRELSFKVALTPSLTNVGQAAVLVQNINISGIDEFTGEVLEDIESRIDTRLLNESGFDIESGIVVE